MRLAGCEMESMTAIFKTDMLIYQSKANLDDKTLFSKITHHLDPDIRKMLVRGMSGNELVHDLLVIEVKILFMKLTLRAKGQIKKIWYAHCRLFIHWLNHQMLNCVKIGFMMPVNVKYIYMLGS